MDTNINNNLENKKNNTFVIIILILIILGVIALVCYLFFSKKEMENNDQSDISVEKNSIKLDNTKDYVYDAEYKYNSKYYRYARVSKDAGIDKKLVTNENVTLKDEYLKVNEDDIPFQVNINVQYLKDLKVPYININSDDAKKVNQELENLYMEYAEYFDESATPDDIGIMTHLLLNYKKYTNGNVISIVVVDGAQATAPWYFQYHTYNFNITTGKLLSYKDIYTKAGIKESDIDKKTETAITNKLKEKYNYYKIYEYDDIDEWLKESLANYKKELQNNTFKYYLGENGKLFTLPLYFLPIENTEYNYNTPVN